jgi:hypothetical protein
MAFLPDLDRTSFENLTKGIHDLTDAEIARLHEMATEVKGIVQAAIERQDRAMMTRNQFRQVGPGPLLRRAGVIEEDAPIVTPTTVHSAPGEIRNWDHPDKE